ncbi:MAG: DMT family transporter [Acidimicrobiales bacterium]
MVYLLAVVAAIANAATSVLQRMAVEDAPAEDSMKVRLMARALRRPVWLFGFVLMIVSFVAQAVALHLGRLSEVQPILTTELLFLVLILGTLFRFAVGWREWLGATAAAAGLAGFLVFASPTGGNVVPSDVEWLEVGLPCVAVMGLAVWLARRGPRWWRAGMFGAAAAVGYAVTATMTKVVTGLVAKDWVAIFWHWQTYGLAAFGVAAVFLTQNAYHAGPIAASQSTLVLLDPLVSILLGVGLFGDNLRTAGAWGPLEALSLLVLFGGALLLCQSPLVSGVKGDGSAHEEFLSTRWRPPGGDGPRPRDHPVPGLPFT